MSRVGLTPIKVPDSVAVELNDQRVIVKGSRGELSLTLPAQLSIRHQDNQLLVSRSGESTPARALHGTFARLIDALVVGVSTGWQKQLELVGLGYRASVESDQLVLLVGFTHPVKIHIPDTLQVTVEKNIITVTGSDKQQVGQFASVVRLVRKPEPYKGKGIRYRNEIVRRKQGKSAKGAA